MADSEKITINMGVVDLGQVDLLVSEGFYSNRTDFIRTAIRNQLAIHADVVKDTVKRKIMVLGVMVLDGKELEARRVKGQLTDIKVVGMMTIASDVTPELARETINSLQVFGVLNASDAVRKAIEDRIK